MNPLIKAKALFPMGRLVATPGVLALLSHRELIGALGRHSRGDWGEVDDEDQAANDRALKCGARLLSVFVTAGGARFWIITEADRSTTTILLPGEY